MRLCRLTFVLSAITFPSPSEKSIHHSRACSEWRGKLHEPLLHVSHLGSASPNPPLAGSYFNCSPQRKNRHTDEVTGRPSQWMQLAAPSGKRRVAEVRPPWWDPATASSVVPRILLTRFHCS
jgi:hypothetical protein